jgi:hypothetical protein
VTDAELRALLNDCLALWDVKARLAAGDGGLQIQAEAGTFLVQRVPGDMRAVRWLLQTPERHAADRPPRAVPSIVALLSALRNALGAERGTRVIIGASPS